MKKLLVLALCALFVACQQDNKEAEQLLKKKITELENKLEAKKSKNTDLQLQIYNIKSNSIEKDYVELLFGDIFSHFETPSDLFQFAFDDLKLEERDLITILTFHYSSFSGQGCSNLYNNNNKNQWYTYLTSQCDRSTKAIKKYLTQENKEFIYNLFYDNSLYEDSGANAIVEALLAAYVQLQNEKQILDTLYSELRNNEAWETIQELASTDVKQILADENYSNYRKKADFGYRVFYVYSFWARRHHEGNKEIIYEILKDFHENVAQK